LRSGGAGRLQALPHDWEGRGRLRQAQWEKLADAHGLSMRSAEGILEALELSAGDSDDSDSEERCSGKDSQDPLRAESAPLPLLLGAPEVRRRRQRIFSFSVVRPLENYELLDWLVEQFRMHSGVPKSQRFLLRRYSQVFAATQFVDWLMALPR